MRSMRIATGCFWYEVDIDKISAGSLRIPPTIPEYCCSYAAINGNDDFVNVRYIDAGDC
jgi:hypothetical protein